MKLRTDEERYELAIHYICGMSITRLSTIFMVSGGVINGRLSELHLKSNGHIRTNIPKKDKTVLTEENMRIVLDIPNHFNHSEMGRKLGISSERIGQIQRKFIAKIKNLHEAFGNDWWNS